MWNAWWNNCIKAIDGICQWMLSGHWIYPAAVLLPVLVLVLLVIRGLRRVDKETVNAARTLGMTRRAILRHVMLPQARGRILIGLLLAVAIGAAEYIAMLHYGVL